tara:strand:- start:521 stop:925 length:405 start_codon:yes stop_codon:yes gene_type:complete
MRDNETIQFAQKQLGKSFAWGTNDCNTLVCKYIDEVWGKDTLKIPFQNYNNKTGAIRFQKNYPKSLTEVIIDAGATKISSKLATVGDILIVDRKYFQLGHICLGTNFLSVPENQKTAITRLLDFSIFDWALRIN